MGQRLQELRRRAHLSQSQLARAAEVPIGSLRNWEHGRRTPLLDAAARLARALGVRLDLDAGLVLGELAGIEPAPTKRKGK
jgi:transcriptional regulator with XRE-family HTH domain